MSKSEKRFALDPAVPDTNSLNTCRPVRHHDLLSEAHHLAVPAARAC